MKTNLLNVFFLLALLVHSPLYNGFCNAQSPHKKVYLSFIVHGNMNYDRYVRPTIWRDFPVIYDYFLDFMDEHSDFKGQIQFSGQTFNSLKQAAPKVIEHAISLHKKGQLNFTGTFYSEPVNINMDGETNFRCAKLGTSIIEQAVGFTDGFYLQERAYHAQLPWILNHANVSWTPVITGDDTAFPFKLKGLDGSVSVCVPICKRQAIVDLIQRSPDKSLLLIEDDYEIPQVFSENYKKISTFLESNKDIDVEWITVKEYIGKFGVKEERYVDHSAKGKDINNGTYSRWTADPLDIIVQDYTNHAMSAFRAATIVNSLTTYLYNSTIDEPMISSKFTLKHDPLIWNIERADLYPDVESQFLTRNGKVTLMSRAEHLLLWAVNSDAKGWFPLYEKRRERINSFENSEAISKEIINRGLDVISQKIRIEGYDRYFIIFNAQPERTKVVQIETDVPYDLYDYTSGRKLKNTTLLTEGKYRIDFESKFPAYGYKIIGLRRARDFNNYSWENGTTVENGKMKLEVSGDKVLLSRNGTKIELSLDTFKIRALAEMTDGKGDEIWRKAVPYGDSRISVRNSLYPQLRVERQIDWLIHMQQTFTLMGDRLLCEINFIFPHPTLVRKNGATKGNTFDPQGLTFIFNTGKPGKIFYDIPFAFTPNLLTGLSYFCPLSSGIFQFDAGGGFMVTTSTGEQAFYTKPGEGEVGLYMGASTTSGPIRDVGLEFVSHTNIKHEPAWYSEPFHGNYIHKFMLYPYDGTWQENHAPSISKSYTDDVFLREVYPGNNTVNLETEKNLISVDQPGIEITSMDVTDKGLSLRVNDKEGKQSTVNITIGKKNKKAEIQANGIINITL
jgi:hypothetical protein